MIELHKRYSLVTAQGVVSLDGAKLIEQYIQSQRIIDGSEWKRLNPDYPHWWIPALPDDWDWSWLIDKKGTFPRRVSRYYFKNHNLKSPDGFLAQIGNIARAHSYGHESESFDFDDNFDWQDGDFGDGNSCYWWNGEAGLEALRSNGFKAIRFYASSDSDEGIGRAWLYELRSDLFILFNGYGYSTITIAAIFASFMGLSYKRIGLSNHYSTTGVLYINNDAGYIIGTWEDIAGYTSYDLEIDCEEFDICVACGTHMHEDEVYFSPYGEPYCESCFDRHYYHCDECGETHSHDDLTYVETNGFDVCSYCLERHYSYCDHCEQYHRHTPMYEHDGQDLCWECLNDITSPPGWAE